MHLSKKIKYILLKTRVQKKVKYKKFQLKLIVQWQEKKLSKMSSRLKVVQLSLPFQINLVESW